MVKQKTTLGAAIQVARSLEYILEGIITTKEEVGEKRKGEEILKPNKKGRFLKYDPNDEKLEGRNIAIWCEKCVRKHFGQYIEAVTYYRWGKTDHYAKKCVAAHKECFKCGESYHFK